MATIQDLANYIMQMEGYNVAGSLAQRNNNPGNLRSSPYATGSNSGYAVFSDAQTGYNALLYQIQLDQSRGLSLAGFISKYAPPSENNTTNYLQFVSNGIGVSPSTNLSDLGNSSIGPDTNTITGTGEQVATVSSTISSSLSESVDNMGSDISGWVDTLSDPNITNSSLPVLTLVGIGIVTLIFTKIV